MSVNDVKVMSAVSKEISRRYNVKADLIGAFNRQYDKPHVAHGSNSGSSINIVKPMKVSGAQGETLKIQDTEEKVVSLGIDRHYHIGLGFTAAQLTDDLLNPKNMKLFGDHYLNASLDNVIATVQSEFYTYIKDNTYNAIGMPGVGPVSYKSVTDARSKLNNYRSPKGDRSYILSPDDAALLNEVQSGLFNPSKAISSNYRDGELSPSNNFDFIESCDVGSHTNGTGSSYVIDGASQSGDSIAIRTGTGNITKGSKITIAGCYAVDPISGARKPFLQRFTVKEDYAGGDGTISLEPGLSITGAYKTVSALPADGAAISIFGSASQTFSCGIAAHRDSFVFGSSEIADIGLKHEVAIKTSGAGETYGKFMGSNNGVFMKLSMDGDINNLRSVARLDIRYGFGSLLNEWSTLVAGQ